MGPKQHMWNSMFRNRPQTSKTGQKSGERAPIFAYLRSALLGSSEINSVGVKNSTVVNALDIENKVDEFWVSVSVSLSFFFIYQF